MQSNLIAACVLIGGISFLPGCYTLLHEQGHPKTTGAQIAIDAGHPLPVRIEDRCMYDTLRAMPKDAEWLESPAGNLYTRMPRNVLEVLPQWSGSKGNPRNQHVWWIRAYVDSAGEVIRACIIRSDSDMDLDEPILRAAMQWQFEPAFDGLHALGAFVSFKIAPVEK